MQTIINPSPESWDLFVRESEYGGFMQTTAWEKVKRQEGWDSFRIALEENGSIKAAALILKTEDSNGSILLYSPEGPVLEWHQPTASSYIDLLVAAVKLQEAGQPIGCWRLEPWALHVFDTTLERFTRSAIDMQPRHTALIPIVLGEEALMASFHQKVRYNIRVAERDGVTVKVSSSPEAFQEFYSVYQKTVEKKEIASKEYSYFAAIGEYLGTTEQAFILTATKNNIAIASILLIRFGNRLTYFFGGFDYNYRQHMAPYLCHYDAIRLGQQLGCEFYDLWGIANSDDPEHPWHFITDFKLKFSPIKISLTGAYDVVFDQEHYAKIRAEEEK